MRLKTKTRKTFENMGGSSWKTLISYQSAPRFPRGVSQVLTPQKTFRSAKGDRFLQVLTPQAKFWGDILNLANDHQTSQFDFCVIGSHGMDFVWDSSMWFDWKHCHPTGRSPAGPEGTYWRRSIRSLQAQAFWKRSYLSYPWSCLEYMRWYWNHSWWNLFEVSYISAVTVPF